MSDAKSLSSSIEYSVCTRTVDAGLCARLTPVLLAIVGRIGRGINPPPQLGHTLAKMSVTQRVQNVHSKLQIIASVECGGRSISQHSQLGRISNMVTPYPG